MNRTQFLAAVALVAVVFGLVASRIGSDGDSTAEPAATGAEQASQADATAGEEESQASDGARSTDSAQTEEAAPATTPVAEPPPLLGKHPGIDGLDGWLQTDAEDFEAFDGQVRIVQFWTFGCHNCTATIPHLQEIYADWHDDGLEIIGVHAPEFSYEAEVDNIANAAVDLGVSWPIAIDTEKKNFRSWQGNRRFWPRTYVLDQNGEIRFDRIGEGKYDELAETVAYLIENGP